MSKKDILNIVDENDEVIGEASREKIHKEGLLHREVGVWFYNKKGEVIFQLRGLNQETYPNLLDATAGGHVEMGDNYQDTAVKEVKEETGIDIKGDSLVLVAKTRSKSFDQSTGKINNKYGVYFIYQYDDDIENLLPTEGQRFESWLVDKLLNIKETDKIKFIPSTFKSEKQKVFQKIKELTS